ncbi:MAG: radical SAM protein [Candidatus Omnitrophica bacterium]|nr:radical SAM protein [Candidatus Omnitrophota bacterium]
MKIQRPGNGLHLDRPPRRFRLPRPQVLVLFTSYQCDARCAMCSTWVKQKSEPSISHEQIEKLFNDPLLKSSLEILNLTGGEPTLNPDLVSNVKTAVETCSRLRRVDLPTNGMNTGQVVDQIERLAAAIADCEVHLGITVSMDGLGPVHEAVRNRKGVFPQVERTLMEVQELTRAYPFMSVGINMTVGNQNADELFRMRNYARKRNIGINFTPAAISEIGVESALMKDDFLPSEVQRAKIADFFDILEESGEMLANHAQFAANWLRTGRRTLDCSFRQGRNCLLEPDGSLYLCGNFKEFKLGNVWETSFTRAWRNMRRIPSTAWRKCVGCESNCYLNP